MPGVFRPNVDEDLVFVIMPFGAPFDGYYQQIIKQAVRELGRRTVRSDELYGTRAIVADIWNQIWTAAAVIADVTDRNPNVNYELGLCHALGVPTVLMTRRIEDVPFDYRHRRCIVYQTDNAGWESKLSSDIKSTLQSVFAAVATDVDLQWPYDVRPVEAVSSTALLDASEALVSITAGAGTAAQIISRAFGPRGQRIALRNDRGEAISVRHSEVVASLLPRARPGESIGIRAMSTIARDVHLSIGDGSKRAVIVGAELLTQGARQVQAGVRAPALVRGLERRLQAIFGLLESGAKAAGPSEIYAVATTATRSTTLADALVDALERVGKDGLISVESMHHAPPGVRVHADPGIRLESGFLSESFVTDARTAACVLEEPFILLCDFKLVSMKELLPVLESVAEKGRALLIIADAVEGEALTTLTVNVQRGSLKSCAIRAPGFGDRRTRLLGDLAALTGAELLNAASGRKLESARVSDLGTARKAIISADDTTLLEAGGDRAAVERRSERVRAELLRAKDPSARAALQERLAVLAGAVASVQVAGVTPTDTRELADDAVHGLRSVESAIRSGWLPGGGWPEVFASIHATTLEDLDNADHAAGECLAAALRAPCAFLSATAFEIVDPAELRLYAAKVVAEGVLDSTAVVTGALATAWSHVRAVLETAVWDFGTGAAAVERDDAASVPDFGDM